MGIVAMEYIYAYSFNIPINNSDIVRSDVNDIFQGHCVLLEL